MVKHPFISNDIPFHWNGNLNKELGNVNKIITKVVFLMYMGVIYNVCNMVRTEMKFITPL